MNERRRVVITGFGAVTPVGNNVESMWTALLAGQSGAGPITRFDTTEFSTTIACEVTDFDGSDFLDKKDARRYDLFAQFGMVSALEAMAHSGLNGPPSGVAPERFGVIFGSGIGGISTMEAQHDIIRERGPRRQCWNGGMGQRCIWTLCQ